MIHTLTHQIKHLEKLLETDQNPKIIWEEMQNLGNQAFDLQDQIMLALDQAEETETDIQSVQQLFEAREYVWDLMNQIALLEAHLKDKTFPNGKGEKEHTCCHHNAEKKKGDACHCNHTHKEGHTCSSHSENKQGCCCKRKKTTTSKKRKERLKDE